MVLYATEPLFVSVSSLSERNFFFLRALLHNAVFPSRMKSGRNKNNKIENNKKEQLMCFYVRCNFKAIGCLYGLQMRMLSSLNCACTVQTDPRTCVSAQWDLKKMIFMLDILDFSIKNAFRLDVDWIKTILIETTMKTDMKKRKRHGAWNASIHFELQP